jgi:hypothetical protein
MFYIIKNIITIQMIHFTTILKALYHLANKGIQSAIPQTISTVSSNRIQALIINEKTKELLQNIKLELETDYMKVKAYLSTMDIKDSKHSEIFELLSAINNNLSLVDQEIAVQSNISNYIIGDLRNNLKLTPYTLNKIDET